MPETNTKTDERKEERRRGDGRWPFGNRAAAPTNEQSPEEPAPPPELTPWDKVQLARHPRRPHTLDYIRTICTDFVELHGDRRYGDDAAMLGGLARFHDRTVVVIGHQKGRDARENVTAQPGHVAPRGLP